MKYRFSCAYTRYIVLIVHVVSQFAKIKSLLLERTFSGILLVTRSFSMFLVKLKEFFFLNRESFCLKVELVVLRVFGLVKQTSL